MSTDATSPTSNSRKQLEVLTAPFSDASPAWWRDACLTAWVKVLDLLDEAEIMKDQLGITNCAPCRRYPCEQHKYMRRD